ncbi:hypothetical protein HMPREF0742_01422 [Rothia aeria F0184]|uniref:Uncharacterized protein n=1 Tax=Rothia aeria F0184 TaxID=888019 RepID=U7V2W4_9MICC|nr:hypothetical protein HMPREF0742_01422 [Rothia aeria F0184]
MPEIYFLYQVNMKERPLDTAYSQLNHRFNVMCLSKMVRV